MSERTLHIRVESDASAFRRAKAAARRIDSGLRVDDNEQLGFADMQTFLAALSSKRLALVAVLKREGPSSIRALSKAAARDYKSVHQDVQVLMELGLIEKRSDNLIEAPYDRIVSDIRMAAA